MQALFSLKQHGALEAIQARLRPSERLVAFLDDIYCVISPERTGAGFTAIQEELLTIGIRVHDGKTQLWNRSGQVIAGAEATPLVARRSHPDAIVWRGDVSFAHGRARRDSVRDADGTSSICPVAIGSGLGTTRPAGVLGSCCSTALQPG